jgi:Mrp family chromosome partitioning ATPase
MILVLQPLQGPLEGINQAASNLRANYILVYVVAEPISINKNTYYILGSGGDESKAPVFYDNGRIR